MTGAGVAVELDAVSVVLDGSTLLTPTSAAVPAGGTLVVRGPNGSGKSTLLRVVAGVRAPTTGTATVDGRAPDPRRRAFRQLVAGTVESPVPARDLTLAEHVALVATTWGTPVRAARTFATELLGRLGVAELAARFPHELSSGQTQLAAIAVVLARPSALLLLDEPEQRLDADRVATVAELLAERRAAGTTLLVATHSDALEAALGGPVLRLVPAVPGAPDDVPDNDVADDDGPDDDVPDASADGRSDA
ncbi:ATP-binding cassette domain-containing protein [Flavimobilis sp. GY10621]|uniref:ATP-binding cassette domain-containing protein n=1 Tax=Flavimobilis rhizosphaerae TaxID=2775421 RepID=A0ABR9DLA5_9MICO|nr:ATP-binding cassette domain-containing protein [Flavimobilis rhizosphaerae]MBD9697922.1 ATP-binding cassette domain-containing protein [Flavimobilis rhizosphaerae]